MEHYVCTGGCGGTSEMPGAVCENETCPKQGEPMTPCYCTDGKHEEAMADAEEEEDAEEEG